MSAQLLQASFSCLYAPHMVVHGAENNLRLYVFVVWYHNFICNCVHVLLSTEFGLVGPSPGVYGIGLSDCLKYVLALH